MIKKMTIKKFEKYFDDNISNEIIYCSQNQGKSSEQTCPAYCYNIVFSEVVIRSDIKMITFKSECGSMSIRGITKIVLDTILDTESITENFVTFYCEYYDECSHEKSVKTFSFLFR